MTKTVLISGNAAVAYGVKMSRAKVISAYPITPSTTMVEYLAEFVAKGELDAEYIHPEGEHSAVA
ncbi:MAG: pyruvate ferredoxin oxidoreductase, partial [Desulfurococcaceae archaeon]